jgi:hypothetical protein
MKKQYVIYCDLDSVLVSFDSGYEQLTGLHTKHHDLSDKDAFWNLFGDKLKEKNISEKEYWANLDWMSDGIELWDYIKKHKPHLLTAPSVNRNLAYKDRYKLEFNECMQGKTEWIKRLDNKGKIYFKSAKHKSDLAGPYNILIDDREDTIYNWIQKGGVGIVHTSTQETIKQLQILDL